MLPPNSQGDSNVKATNSTAKAKVTSNRTQSIVKVTNSIIYYLYKAEQLILLSNYRQHSRH